MDYTVFFGHDHSGQLPLSLIAPEDYDLNIQGAACSDPASGTSGNTTHRHMGSSPLGPYVHSPTSSPLDTSIPAWLMSFGDTPEPSVHAGTWDSSPPNHPEQQQHPAQLLGSATMKPHPNVDILQGWIPSASIPAPPRLNTGNVEPIVIRYADHGAGYPAHHASSYGHGNSPFFSET
jgi:hypothetical protein